MVRRKNAIFPGEQQQYDSALKALFEESTADMLSFAVGEPVAQVRELSGEVLKPPLRVDCGYEGWYKGKLHVVHTELQTDGDSEMVYRMIEYFGILYRKYKKPITSIILYPFRTSVPESPLLIVSDDEDEPIAIFRFRVIKLWEIEAASFLKEWPASLYALLPTMKGAGYHLLSYTLDTMQEFYGEQRRVLATKLVLFDVFLKRTDTVSVVDKEKVLQKMDQFADLMAQSPFVQKQSAKARMEGKEQGILEGRVEGQIGMLQSNILRIVSTRFPQLTEMAQEKVCQMNKMKALDDLFNKLLVATDNEAARLIVDAAEA